MMGDQTDELVIATYEIDSVTQNSVKSALFEVLRHYACEELTLPIFTCINELLVNAVKANYKSIYFETYNSRNKLGAMIPYEKAMEIFRFEIGGEGVRRLSRIAEEKGLHAVLRVGVRSGVLHISVSNNSVMTEIERRNVAIKVAAVGKLDQMSDFFEMEDDHASECAGLGIVLIGMMLRSLGLNTEYFSINPERNSTTATLTIPLNDHTLEAYRSVSGR